MFQQKLDVSGVWFARNNWPVLIHSELDGSVQNCAVFVIILRKPNLKDFIYKFSLSPANRMSSPCRQPIEGSVLCR